MITRPPYRLARHQGRMAVVAHRLQGEAAPVCPFHRGTKRERYWQLGRADGERLVAQLLDLALAQEATRHA